MCPKKTLRVFLGFLLDMEDVPLDDFKVTTTTRNEPTLSVEEEEAQLAKYKTLLGTTIEIMKGHAASNSGWNLISVFSTNITLYEKTLVNDNYYLLKVKAVLQGRASRYAHVIRDHEEHTRMVWDAGHIVSCKEYETYKADEGDIVVVESVWRSLHPRVFSDRRAFGILTSVYNEEYQTYSLYFCSADHVRFCPGAAPGAPGGVLIHASLGIVLRKLSAAETELTMVLKVDPKVSTFAPLSFLFVQSYKEELCKRVQLYEQVVQAWDTYYGPSKDPKRVENRR